MSDQVGDILWRFDTEDRAIAAGKSLAETGEHDEVHVIESPRGGPRSEDEAGRFVVTTDGFTRAWERTIEVFYAEWMGGE